MIDFEEDIINGSETVETTNKDDYVWVNKYRPTTLEHFCLDEKLKKMFQNQIDSNDLQNVCLIGGPGIGKTTLALILANCTKDTDILFIGCAGGQGKVENISSDIIPFCQSASRGRKVIILDELDSASSTQANSFQKALRNIIEKFPDCRWIATANYQSNIISPILSRLPPISLTFSVSDMVNNLIYILKSENIEIVSEPEKVRKLLGTLIKSYYPDIRMVIGQLQHACVGGKLDVDAVVIDNANIVKTTLSYFIEILNKSTTPLDMRKAYNNEVLTFGNDGRLAILCSPLGLATELFNHIVDNYPNASYEDLMILADYLYKIEHVADGETQLFAFLIKVKSMNLH